VSAAAVTTAATGMSATATAAKVATATSAAKVGTAATTGPSAATGKSAGPGSATKTWASSAAVSGPSYTCATVARTSYATVARASDATVSAASVAVPAATVAISAPAPSATAPAATIPWADADEVAASEPFRPVIPVGGAVIRVIGVISVIAYRRTILVRDWRKDRTESDADENACLSRSRE